MRKESLVNKVLPDQGDYITTKMYRELLERLGYNFNQTIGSIGGSIANGVISIDNKIAKRVK